MYLCSMFLRKKKNRTGTISVVVVASPEVLEREMFDEHRAEAVFAVAGGWSGLVLIGTSQASTSISRSELCP